MVKKTIRGIEISGKRLVIHVDFNVPICEDGSIANDRRIRAALPTIRHCPEDKPSLVLMTHLGRPSGEFDEKLGMGRMANRLQELFCKAPMVIADIDWKQRADEPKPGVATLLENLRFNPGEKCGDEQFARRLREVYVNDASATGDPRTRRCGPLVCHLLWRILAAHR